MMTMLGPFALAVEHSTRTTKKVEVLIFIVIWSYKSRDISMRLVREQKTRGVRWIAIWFSQFVVLTSAIDLALLHFFTSYRGT